MTRTLFTLLSFALVLAVGATTSAASAQDRIRLAEIVPALAGSELGAIDLGPAPPPGASRVMRRAEVLETLARAGRSATGLVIPREVRIARRAVRLSGDEIAARARDAIEEALSPCAVESVAVTSSATLGEGELDVHVNGPARPNDGPTIVMLDLATPGGTTHVPARVEVRCPEAVVTSGAEVTVVVRSGNVRVTATGVSRQSGRVGDEVRVRVEPTGALVTARVIDVATVEVRP
ncbi:MAG: flagella basal body P-ring formation protein FlgA [Sandaracinaceae bacterium]|jgi:hypothetical protein|nr:flagella basal body P-ring formation protein FlgA [Sandaracinaceae bacterium]